MQFLRQLLVRTSQTVQHELCKCFPVGCARLDPHPSGTRRVAAPRVYWNHRVCTQDETEYQWDRLFQRRAVFGPRLQPKASKRLFRHCNLDHCEAEQLQVEAEDDSCRDREAAGGASARGTRARLPTIELEQRAGEVLLVPSGWAYQFTHPPTRARVTTSQPSRLAQT